MKPINCNVESFCAAHKLTRDAKNALGWRLLPKITGLHWILRDIKWTLRNVKRILHDDVGVHMDMEHSKVFGCTEQDCPLHDNNIKHTERPDSSVEARKQADFAFKHT